MWQEDWYHAAHRYAATIGAAMNRDFNVLVERDSAGYYVASVASLPGCHTQAKSLDVLMERIREAIELCLEVEGDREPLDFIGVQRVTLPA
jgi:predicted RNase H-like HicB family nuclease